MLGLESWIPMYMTGQSSRRTTLRGAQSSPFHGHLLTRSLGRRRSSGECRGGPPQPTGQYHLSNSPTGELDLLPHAGAEQLLGRAPPR